MKLKPDTMLIESQMIVDAMRHVGELGIQKALEGFEAREQELSTFITQNATVLVGKLALAGASPQVVQGVHEDVVTIILTCLGAIKRGYDELWKDTMIGTRLAAIDATLASRETKASPEKSGGRRPAVRRRGKAARRRSIEVGRMPSPHRPKEQGNE